jgi:hypothetical protein
MHKRSGGARGSGNFGAVRDAERLGCGGTADNDRISTVRMRLLSGNANLCVLSSG